MSMFNAPDWAQSKLPNIGTKPYGSSTNPSISEAGWFIGAGLIHVAGAIRELAATYAAVHQPYRPPPPEPPADVRNL